MPDMSDKRPDSQASAQTPQPAKKIDPRKYMENWVSTREFCRHAHIALQTAHLHHQRYGHYYNVVPRKQPNGRLHWPLHDWFKRLDAARTIPARKEENNDERG